MNHILEMSLDNWLENYEPMINKRNDGYGIAVNDDFYMFETFGDDIREIIELNKTMPLQIWTWITDDNGDDIIVDGFHYINRIGYFVTKIPAIKGTNYIIKYE